MRLALAAALLGLAATPTIAQPTASTAASGQDAFNNRCADCHTLDSQSQSAPTLKGVYGRKIASLPDFAYSDALKAKTGIWDDANLNAFLASPQTFAKGTAMYGSAPDPTERQAIIDYLKTVK